MSCEGLKKKEVHNLSEVEERPSKRELKRICFSFGKWVMVDYGHGCHCSFLGNIDQGWRIIRYEKIEVVWGKLSVFLLSATKSNQKLVGNAIVIIAFWRPVGGWILLICRNIQEEDTEQLVSMSAEFKQGLSLSKEMLLDIVLKWCTTDWTPRGRHTLSLIELKTCTHLSLSNYLSPGSQRAQESVHISWNSVIMLISYNCGLSCRVSYHWHTSY